MLKKILLGALLVGVIGVLIAGAVIRTNATGAESAGEGGRRGRSTEVVPAVANEDGAGASNSEALTGANGNGGRWAQSDTELELGGQGNGRGGQGRGTDTAGAGQIDPLADVSPEEWTDLTGVVLSADDSLVEVMTDAGEVIPFEGRPLSFAAEQGFSVKVGDSVTLSGYDEDGEFKIGKVTKPGDGASVVLRDVSGRPGWAGRGRQGQG